METISKIIDIWMSGGPVMIGLFLLSLLIYSQAFQLLMYVNRTNIRRETDGQWAEWVRDPDKAVGRVGEMIRYGQSDTSTASQIRSRFDEIRMGLTDMLDGRIKFLNTLVAAAPLLGLLGTVMGMLSTFFGIATSGGSETAGVVASGISEALITTQTGLTVALPGLFIVMIIQRVRHRLVANIARLESLTLTHLRYE